MNVIVERWLAAVRTHVDPRNELFALNAGASREAIAEWRSVLKTNLAIDLHETVSDLYLTADGQGASSPGVFFGLHFQSFAELSERYGALRAATPWERETARSNPPGAIKPAWFNKRWLPFARDNGGNYLALDYDPGDAGTEGQVITLGQDEITQSVVARTFDEFLQEQTQLIEAQNFVASSERFHLKSPPLAHFLDRYSPERVERARRLEAHPTPSLRAELVPVRPVSIDMNEAPFGTWTPDIRRVERLIVSTRPGELWIEWRCEGNLRMSQQVPVQPEELEAAFHREVTTREAQGFSRDHPVSRG